MVPNEKRQVDGPTSRSDLSKSMLCGTECSEIEQCGQTKHQMNKKGFSDGVSKSGNQVKYK